jgi:hypothetical protein
MHTAQIVCVCVCVRARRAAGFNSRTASRILIKPISDILRKDCRAMSIFINTDSIEVHFRKGINRADRSIINAKVQRTSTGSHNSNTLEMEDHVELVRMSRGKSNIQLSCDLIYA